MGFGVELYGLVAAVQACHVALAAVHAQVVVDEGEFLVFVHIIDVVNVLRAGTLDLIDCWDFADIHIGAFLACTPEVKLVLVFLELLGLEDRWALAFPAHLDQVLSLSEIQQGFQTG